MAGSEPPEHIEWPASRVSFLARGTPWAATDVIITDNQEPPMHTLISGTRPADPRWRCFGCFAEDTHAIAGTATHSCEERNGEPFRPTPATPRSPRGSST